MESIITSEADPRYFVGIGNIQKDHDLQLILASENTKHEFLIPKMNAI